MNSTELKEFLISNNVDELKLKRFDNASQDPYRTFFQVYGLPRTGTNFAKCWVQDNFNIFYTEFFGYKHASPPYQIDWTGSDWRRPHGLIRPNKVALAAEMFTEVNKAFDNKKFFFIMTVKNPYSWYVSNLSFGGGSRINRDTKKVMIMDGKQGNPRKASWMDWYNERNWEYINYFKTRPETSYIVCYEDYIKIGVENVINNVSKHFNLPFKNNEIIIRDYLVGHHSDISPKPKEDGKRYHDWSLYEKEFYMDLLDKESIEFINNNVDKKIMEYFNYEFK